MFIDYRLPMKMLESIVFSRVCQFLCSGGGAGPHTRCCSSSLHRNPPPHHTWTLLPAPFKLGNLDLTIQTPPPPPTCLVLFNLDITMQGHTPAMSKLVYYVFRKSEDRRAVIIRLKYLLVQHSLIFKLINIPTVVL